KGPVIYSVSSLAYEPATRTIFYTADNNAHRDLMAVDVRTKKTRMLIKDARVGDLAWNASDRSLWGIRHFNGICTLVRVPPPYTGEGFVPATIEARPLTDVSAITFLGHELAEKHPVIKSWTLGSPAAIPFDVTQARKGPYRPAKSLRLESFYPVVEGYKDFAA